MFKWWSFIWDSIFSHYAFLRKQSLWRMYHHILLYNFAINENQSIKNNQSMFPPSEYILRKSYLHFLSRGVHCTHWATLTICISSFLTLFCLKILHDISISGATWWVCNQKYYQTFRNTLELFFLFSRTSYTDKFNVMQIFKVIYL